MRQHPTKEVDLACAPSGAPSRPSEEARTTSAAEAPCRRRVYVKPAEYPSRAYIVADASCLTRGMCCILRGAASVGRCLFMHAPRYDNRGRRQEWPSLWTTVPRAALTESMDYRAAPMGESRLGCARAHTRAHAPTLCDPVAIAKTRQDPLIMFARSKQRSARRRTSTRAILSTLPWPAEQVVRRTLGRPARKRGRTAMAELRC